MKTPSFYPLLDKAIAHITATSPAETYPEHNRIIMYGEAFRLREGVESRRRAELAVLRWFMAELDAKQQPPRETPREHVERVLRLVWPQEVSHG